MSHRCHWPSYRVIAGQIQRRRPCQSPDTRPINLSPPEYSRWRGRPLKGPPRPGPSSANKTSEEGALGDGASAPPLPLPTDHHLLLPHDAKHRGEARQLKSKKNIRLGGGGTQGDAAPALLPSPTGWHLLLPQGIEEVRKKCKNYDGEKHLIGGNLPPSLPSLANASDHHPLLHHDTRQHREKRLVS